MDIVIIAVTRSNERRQRGSRGRSHGGTRLQLMKSTFAGVDVQYVYGSVQAQGAVSGLAEKLIS